MLTNEYKRLLLCESCRLIPILLSLRGADELVRQTLQTRKHARSALLDCHLVWFDQLTRRLRLFCDYSFRRGKKEVLLGDVRPGVRKHVIVVQRELCPYSDDDVEVAVYLVFLVSSSPVTKTRATWSNRAYLEYGSSNSIRQKQTSVKLLFEDS